MACERELAYRFGRRLADSVVLMRAALPTVPSHDPVSREAKSEKPGSESAMSCDVSRTSSSLMSVDSVVSRRSVQHQSEALAS